MPIIAECWTFLKERRRFWLTPAIVVLVLVVGMLFLAQGAKVLPFVYRFF